jgi:hypothetical protein
VESGLGRILSAPARGAHVRFRAAAIALVALFAASASAQTFTQRGFIEARGFYFPQPAPNDGTLVMVDLLAREDATYKPADWFQVSGGFDLRANTHDQVEESWKINIRDRGTRRPALSVRRLAATFTRGAVTLDVGKQFVRWGKTDIVTPTDRFAPRDFLNVIDNEFLAVGAVRGVWQGERDSLDAVWVPFFTPSRVPLLDQRWTAVPDAGAPTGGVAFTLVDGGGVQPDGQQGGVRWSHIGAGFELAAMYFEGYNHLPTIDVFGKSGPPEIVITRLYPRIRTVGADAAIPTPWFTIKGETAYFAASSPIADDFLLYVIQIERQTGEWQLVAGYAGEVVTERRAQVVFAPDRGLTRAIVARASYTIDTNRSAAIETSVRQNGKGVYVKGEFSRAQGRHWRTTLTGAVIGGDAEDFLGQYRRNSHAILALRYSF